MHTNEYIRMDMRIAIHLEGSETAYKAAVGTPGKHYCIVRNARPPN